MGRIPALDGLRTIAIAIVVAYHVDNSIVPAGHWGVPLFFVLSGFVLSYVYGQQSDSGSLSKTRFYWARLARIWAARCARICSKAPGWRPRILMATIVVMVACGLKAGRLHCPKDPGWASSPTRPCSATPSTPGRTRVNRPPVPGRG